MTSEAVVKAETAISPGCPSCTELSRKISFSTVFHDDTLLSIAVPQQFVKRDNVWVGQMPKEVDLGIDQLGKHSLVVHSQLDDFEANIYQFKQERISDSSGVLLSSESSQRRRWYPPIGFGYLNVHDRPPFASQGIQPRILLHPNV
jgi:hypothetical protein